jgi:ElaB/YqjD/DUF883 family membrane-anchored ribosome-binding protein
MNVVGTQLDELFAGVDDLIKRVADTENPEIRKIRAKVHASMTVAKSAFAGAAIQARPAAAMDEDLEELDDSEQALGVALLVGVGLGVIMSIQQ